MTIFDLYNIATTGILTVFLLFVVVGFVGMFFENKATKAHYEHLAQMHEQRAKRKALWNA